jgi:hypothetical protein
VNPVRGTGPHTLVGVGAVSQAEWRIANGEVKKQHEACQNRLCKVKRHQVLKLCGLCIARAGHESVPLAPGMSLALLCAYASRAPLHKGVQP